MKSNELKNLEIDHFTANVSKPLVSVVMITYKHEAFIKEAIEGVLMQKCPFPVELIIANDNSPDNTEKIIKKIIRAHPNGYWIKYLKHDINKGMIKNFLWSINQCKGKYIAICEGDDYWTDSSKLEQQVDFLESNEDYGLICGGIKQVDEKGQFIKNNYYHTPKVDDKIFNLFWQLLRKNFIYTLTVCVRKDLLLKYVLKAEVNKLFFIYDYWFWLNIGLVSKIKITENCYGNYRIHSQGITKRKDFFAKRRDLVKNDIVKNCITPKLSKTQKDIVVGIYKRYFRNREISPMQKLTTFFFILRKLKFFIK